MAIIDWFCLPLLSAVHVKVALMFAFEMVDIRLYIVAISNGENIHV